MRRVRESPQITSVGLNPAHGRYVGRQMRYGGFNLPDLPGDIWRAIFGTNDELEAAEDRAAILGRARPGVMGTDMAEDQLVRMQQLTYQNQRLQAQGFAPSQLGDRMQRLQAHMASLDANIARILSAGGIRRQGRIRSRRRG
jgi:hypothetical protein